MKPLHYIIFIIKIENIELYFIKNQNKPICANCKFYIPINNECSKFGEVDIITNEYNYEDAISVRNDNNKCGKDAIFFKKNDFKFITVPYYYLLDKQSTVFFY
jgi:hypothetical protein